MSNCPDCGQTLSLTYEDGGMANPDYCCGNCEWEDDTDGYDADLEEDAFGEKYLDA